MGDHPEPISPERERGEKNRAHGSNGKDGWIGEALERNLCKLNHCAVSSLKYISLSPWLVTLNLNERILKLWKSTRPFGTKVDESNFFTASEGLLPVLLVSIYPPVYLKQNRGRIRIRYQPYEWNLSQQR